MHEVIPVMRSQSKVAYEFSLNFQQLNSSEKQILTEMYLAGREDFFLKVARRQKKLVYVDSRNTFFCYIINILFPDAKFIHLFRHPAEFVRSAIRRKYYQKEHTDELARIEPLKGDKYYIDWKTFDNIQKCSWLWMETNRFIMDFFSKIDKERYFSLNFNTWDITKLMSLMEFMDYL